MELPGLVMVLPTQILQMNFGICKTQEYDIICIRAIFIVAPFSTQSNCREESSCETLLASYGVVFAVTIALLQDAST